MTTNSVPLDIDHALATLDTCGGELQLDFTTVDRLDAPALAALERLSAAARQKDVKVTLRGAPVHVYKVLKLTKLTFPS